MTLDAETLNLKIGETHNVVATVTPENVTTSGVTFASDKEAIATVTAEGVISALGVGVATITVTTKSLQAKDGTAISKTIAVTVTEKTIADIGVSGTYDVKGVVAAITSVGFVLDDGTGAIYIYSVLDSAYKLGDYVSVNIDVVPYFSIWEGSKLNSIAAAEGTAPALADPVAVTSTMVDGWKDLGGSKTETTAPVATKDLVLLTLTATAAVDTSNYTYFTVEGSTTKLEPSKLVSSISIVAGTKYELTFYFGGYNTSYSYASIFVKSAKAIYDAPTSVTVSAAAETVEIGKTVAMSAVVAPATANPAVTWSVANKDTTVTSALATIDEKGILTGAAAGVVVVSAAAVGDSAILGSKEITVVAEAPNPTGLTVSAVSKLIAPTGTTQLTVGFTPENAKNGVTYLSSDTAIATVSTTGLVTGVAAGKATITVASSVDTTITGTIEIEVATSKTIVGSNALAGMAVGDTFAFNDVLAMNKYDTVSKGFIALTEKGMLYIYGSSEAMAAVVKGGHYDVTGTIASYKGAFEATDTTIVENTGAHVELTAGVYATYDLTSATDVAAFKTLVQALPGKDEAGVNDFINIYVTFKNVYIAAVSSKNSYLRVGSATASNFNVLLSDATGAKKFQLSVYSDESPTAASGLVNLTACLYQFNNAFSAGATSANIIGRLQACTITSVA